MVSWKKKFDLYAALGYTPWATAKPIHESHALKRYINKGVRYGGTCIGAMEIVAGMCEPFASSEYWVVAPTYDLTKKLIIGQGPDDWSVHRCFSSSVLRPLVIKPLTESSGNISLTTSTFSGGISLLKGMSADNPESLEARSVNGIVVDECSAIKQEIITQHLIPRVIERNGWILFITRPRRRNWFYAEWMAAFQDGRAWKLPTLSRPWPPDIKARIKEEMSLCSEDVRRELYEADFLPGGGSVFRTVENCYGGDCGPPRPKIEYVAGLDLAKWQDWTWLIVCEAGTGQVVFSERWQRLDWSLTKNKVADIIERYAARLYVDSSGVGDPISEDFVKMGLNVEPVKTGVEKKELIENLVVLMESVPPAIRIPAVCQDLIEELKNYEYTATPGGRLKMGAPPGQHDDGVIALALACTGLQRAGSYMAQIAPRGTAPTRADGHWRIVDV